MILNYTDRFGSSTEIRPVGYMMLFVAMLCLAWVLSL